MKLRVQPILLLGVLLLVGFSGTANAGSIGLIPEGECLSYATTEGTVYFCDRDLRSAGTGVIDPFLKLQRDPDNADGTPDTYSSGFNTDATQGDVPTTNDMDQAHTNSLPIADIGYGTVPTGTWGGGETGYAIFTADIDQQGNPGDPSSIISLNQFILYNCQTNNYTTLAAPNCVEFFNLFNSGDWVNINYKLGSGSGSGDLDVYIPGTVGFAGPNIALLDGWGCGGPYAPSCTSANISADNDGPQEWIRTGVNSNVQPETPVPEPASLLLLGSGLALAGRRFRRRTQAQNS